MNLIVLRGVPASGNFSATTCGLTWPYALRIIAKTLVGGFTTLAMEACAWRKYRLEGRAAEGHSDGFATVFHNGPHQIQHVVVLDFDGSIGRLTGNTRSCEDRT